ncbi:DUF4258 domain-containing protein [Glycocaulis sp.]|uniref:DUF4258 domain-containing protein n=1 Tax=Glycocaulis sp. TaxID=1969725 RepID=UPI003D1E82B3
MRLRLTAHARERIEARGVKTEWIEAAVSHPDRTEPDPKDPDLVRYFKTLPEFNGRVLRVVSRQESGGYTIVTAFFDRGERRSRRE